MIQFGLNLDPISAWSIRDLAIDHLVALLNKLILHYHVLAMLHNSIIWNVLFELAMKGKSHWMTSLLFLVFVLWCIPLVWMKSKCLSAKPRQNPLPVVTCAHCYTGPILLYSPATTFPTARWNDYDDVFWIKVSDLYTIFLYRSLDKCSNSMNFVHLLHTQFFWSEFDCASWVFSIYKT